MSIAQKTIKIKGTSLYAVLCLVIIGLNSCDKWNLQKQLKDFSQNEVVVPVGIRQMVGGRDSVLLNPTVGMARLVLYVDSVACSSCRLKIMHEYAEIVNYSEEVGEGFVPVFVFSPAPNKIGEMIQILESTRFSYPVFIDENQAFPAANPHIPADSRLHTFLLDKNGKVVLVGDPVNNPALWELYKTTITQLIENGGTMPDVEKKD